jgi:hypothetical protein
MSLWKIYSIDHLQNTDGDLTPLPHGNFTHFGSSQKWVKFRQKLPWTEKRGENSSSSKIDHFIHLVKN